MASMARECARRADPTVMIRPAAHPSPHPYARVQVQTFLLARSPRVAHPLLRRGRCRDAVGAEARAGAGQAPAAAPAAAASSRVTSPKEQFGFAIGDDYQLATYEQLTAYWRRLDEQSDRMTLVDIGKTAEGRPQWMAIITSPENHRKLERLKTIARRLALAEDVSTEAEARALAAEGKAVVWIDGGLHANETLGAQQLIETVYQLVSGNDAELTRILDNVVILAVHANPGRPRPGRQLVPARARSPQAFARRPAAALPEVRGPRQQPRLVHGGACRDGQHEPRAVPRVVPADHVQPPPDGPDRHRDVRAAVPRSVQLRLRPADSDQRSTSSARRCTRASPPRTSPA